MHDLLQWIYGTAMKNNAILSVSHLRKTYDMPRGLYRKRDRITAVDDVSFDLTQGMTMGLVGESGCGKSTVARLILCLDTPDSGTVLFKGQNIFTLLSEQKKEFRRSVQIIFQDPYSSLNPRRKAGDIIGEPLKIHKVGSSQQINKRVLELMERVGLQPGHAHRYPHEFSSGQRQRIGIARALSLNPAIIVADEPVSALDVSIQAQTVNLLMDLQKEMGFTYLFISHDLSIVRHVSTTVSVMYKGAIVESAYRDDLYANPLHPYTQALLDAVPIPDPAQKKKTPVIKGEVETEMTRRSGCIFYNRCREADASVCLSAQPQLEEKADAHRAACYLR